MQRVGFAVPFTLDGFDLFEQHAVRADEQAIDATPDAQDEFFRLHVVLKRDFLLVTGRAGTLQLLMAASAGQRAVASDEIAFAAKVSTTQDERDQLADLD
jgi:hypothetical protein